MRKIFFIVSILVGAGVWFVAQANVPEFRTVDFSYEFFIEGIPQETKIQKGKDHAT